MNIKVIRFSLIGAGSFFLLGNGVRFYRLIRTHTEDYFFAPHLLLVLISLMLGWKIMKRGLQESDLTRKDAISLIRTGSVLMGIWIYRLYLLLSHPLADVRERIGEKTLGLAILYIFMGGMVMSVGLYISRSLRRVQQQE